MIARKLWFWTTILALTGLAACTFPTGEGVNGAGLRQTASALAAGGLHTAAAPLPTATGEPDLSIAAGELAVADPVVQAAAGVCNRAAPGLPLDLTVPDGTLLQPGEAFSKTWRLVNAGDCTWDEHYSAVWFSGERLNPSVSHYLRGTVEPGKTVDITVDMVAPSEPGDYQGNWKMSDGKSELFGIGPQGESPFWVRLQVQQPAVTPTLSLLPASTATPLVFTGGDVTLYLQDWVDLDSGQINTGVSDDLTFTREGTQPARLGPGQGTRLAVFGGHAPSESECSGLRLGAESVDLENLKEGLYLCYRSSQGLPGYIRLAEIDLEENMIKLEYLTWSVP